MPWLWRREGLLNVKTKPHWPGWRNDNWCSLAHSPDNQQAANTLLCTSIRVIVDSANCKELIFAFPHSCLHLCDPAV